jgi:uncharacterized protein (TIGR02145 family)
MNVAKFYFSFFSVFFVLSCSTIETDGLVRQLYPILNTTAVSEITGISAISGGYISNAGVSPVSARGAVWSTNPQPTADLPTKTSNGSGNGTFTSNLTGLSPNTTYYVRAYATNSNGSQYSYGQEESFTTKAYNIPGPDVTDIDGNVYHTVTNCNQTWTQSNLKVTKFTDGTTIPQITDPDEWHNTSTAAWCYYNNDPAVGADFGKLYNWYAVAGIYDEASRNNPALRKKLAPEGYHIPTDPEFGNLYDCLGGDGLAAMKLKETGIAFWSSPNDSATNESGFNGRAAGMRDDDGDYFNLYGECNWWTASTDGPNYAWYRYMVNYDNAAYNFSYDFHYGFSVRCLKD